MSSKNGFQGRRARPFGRHRFRALRGDGRRRAWPRARARGDAALPIHLAGIARRRGCGRAERSASATTSLPIESAVRRTGESRWRPLFDGHAARRHRGKSAGARARHHPDGDLEQVRLDGDDHRQQVGNVGRLCDALWRHEWRLQSDQGSLQDRSLPPVGLAQLLEAGWRARARWPGHPGATSSTKPPTAELRENQTDQDSLPPYDILDQILERLVEHEEPIADDRGGGLRPRRPWCASIACSISPNTSAARRRRA